MPRTFTGALKAARVLLLALPVVMFSSAGHADGSFLSGQYRNVFTEQGIASSAAVNKKLTDTYRQLFHSEHREESTGESVFFPVGADMGFIKDIGSNDIRSEGMSYGMMIAVQMNDKETFDKLWRFAAKYMQHHEGWYKGYFAWHLTASEPYRKIDENPAPDGEEYFAMALYFAHNRWGSTEGTLNYKLHADTIVNDMVNKPDSPLDVPMFSKDQKQILFVTQKSAGIFTDPSYHLPAFYELFARWAPSDQALWAEAAKTSRRFFHQASHPQTGLFPEYAEFDGAPRRTEFNKNSHNSAYDAFRVMGNIAMDAAWFGADPAQKDLVERQLSFMTKELKAKGRNIAEHTMDGRPLVDWGSAGQTAMLATSALVTNSDEAKAYVAKLWAQATPTGKWRYYDGLLHMFGLLHLSGQYRIIQ